MFASIFTFFIFFAIGSRGASPQAIAAQKKMKVTIHFTYGATDLRMQIYNVTPELRYSISKTAITADLKRAPLGTRLSGPLKFASEELEKTFVLVMQNKTDRTRYFYASPHTVNPGAASLGLIFECLCNHHVYKIPPHYTWYRIVRLKVDPDDPSLHKQGSVTLDHQIVEVSESDAHKKYNSVLYQEPDDAPSVPAETP
jgi:hypothetical protein